MNNILTLINVLFYLRDHKSRKHGLPLILTFEYTPQRYIAIFADFLIIACLEQIIS